MQKITTHLWFDKGEAEEAAKLYASVFAGSEITGSSAIKDTPSGDVDIITADLWGQEFTLLGAGPEFTFNPSISFHAACKTIGEVDAIWNKLVDGGSVLMELGKYPFSDRYGWLRDKYGLSWQIIHIGDSAPTHTIKPVLMFTQDKAGKAEEAVNLYTSLFKDSNILNIMRYGKGMEPEREGTVQYAAFTLSGKEFGVMDSAQKHEFMFNEAISFIVNCKDQAEIDYYWENLSAVPESEQCGWLKDTFGISWQIVPENMGSFMSGPHASRVTQAFLRMKKIDIAELRKAQG